MADDDYHMRLGALLSELANTLEEMNAMLRGDNNPKQKLVPNQNSIEFKAGWSAGWDACSQEVMKIVSAAGNNIKAIERKRK